MLSDSIFGAHTDAVRLSYDVSIVDVAGVSMFKRFEAGDRSRGTIAP
jgi:hypothetical protein